MPNPEIKFTVVKDEAELAKVNYTKRRAWATQVLALAQAHPNEWLRLDEPTNARYATTHLKPLGLRTRLVGANQKTSIGTIYVMWEVNA
jgi:hypothetical protein